MANKKSPLLISGMIMVIVLGLFLGALQLLKNIYQTETYYVLNQDVSTKTQITPEMLDPIVTQEGTAPPNTLDLVDVQEGMLYSQFPLSEGDVLLYSNVSGFTDISTGIPDDYVITSINIPADEASGGRIHRGVYFDIMVYDSDESNPLESEPFVFYPFVNVLALDTTISMSSASSQDAIDTEEAQDGQVSFYYIGVSPEDAANIELLSRQYKGNIKLLLSPRQNEYAAPILDDFSGIFFFDENLEFAREDGPDPLNLGLEMDSTFSEVERDTFGRPIAKLKNCGVGNAFVSPDPETGECPDEGELPKEELEEVEVIEEIDEIEIIEEE